MQIRCISCKMPISIGRQMVENALYIVHQDNLVYFDFRCPKCKKANKISKEQLLHAAPGWEFKPTGSKEEKVAESKKESEAPKKSVAKKPKTTESKVKKSSAAKAPAKKTTAKKPSSKKTKD